jgi:CRISPR-associated protein Csx17
LLDATVQTLDRVDVNRSFREKGVWWRPLPLEWLPALFGSASPDIEARLALSLASAFPVGYPFALYRFGVQWWNTTREGQPKANSPYAHPKTAPGRWVWRTCPLVQNLCAVIGRRLLDWEDKNERGTPPMRPPIAARMSDVEGWLDGGVDETLLARWLARLALFDWFFIPAGVRMLPPFVSERTVVRPELALYGLLHPLFDLRPVSNNGRKEGRDLLARKTEARTPAAARRMATFMRGGDIESAIKVARSRYAMAQAPLMRMHAPDSSTEIPNWAVADPERLLAALLFPVSDRDRSTLIGRWLRLQRQATEVTHG